MGNKKYEIDYNSYTDKYEIREVDTTPIYSEPSTNPTARERLHDHLIHMNQGLKIFLTFFFNLYGSLFRFSSNTATGFLIGLADFIFGKAIVAVSISGLHSCILKNDFTYFTEDPTAILCIFPFLFWIIDLISIFAKDSIVFLADKKYLNYSDYKKNHK